MAEVHGSCDAAFHSLRDLLQQRLAGGHEVGASLCVNIDGKDVVDLWGGYGDADQTKPWDKDTITSIWSTTKIVTTLAALILVNRGQLDLNENVATYWPEFAANGKENIKVFQILSHSSGVISLDRDLTLEEMQNREELVLKLAEELQDEEKITARLAEQAPWYTTGSAYTGTMYGHLVGKIIRCVTGKSLSQLITEEITEPLGVVDFCLGLPEKEISRTAETIPFPLDQLFPITALDPTSILGRVMRSSLVYPTLPNTAVLRNSQNGAMGGFSNARAMARIASIVSLDGTVDRRQYLSLQTVDEMMRERIRGFDLCLNGKVCFGLGVARPWSESIHPLIPEEDGVCFWSGYGGSFVIMDRRRRMTISYIMNKLENRSAGNSNFDLYLPEIEKCFAEHAKA
ncbi:beta-lactamase [Penicillium angulare]|uniref:beta-lactamase n=1 Tax=Penicillium angulare TaxID=116970 RepID=UPI00253FEC85|nr:beta-lactamase [Penicillium angulare]KAJ5287336.1 beta-lactamase [Penicillium angulare]